MSSGCSDDLVLSMTEWVRLQVCVKPHLPSIVCYPPTHPAGRADYFGSVPNLAARLMAVAQPGQILVDGRLNSLQALQVCQAGVFSHACNGGLSVLQLAITAWLTLTDGASRVGRLLPRSGGRTAGP